MRFSPVSVHTLPTHPKLRTRRLKRLLSKLTYLVQTHLDGDRFSPGVVARQNKSSLFCFHFLGHFNRDGHLRWSDTVCPLKATMQVLELPDFRNVSGIVADSLGFLPKALLPIIVLYSLPEYCFAPRFHRSHSLVSRHLVSGCRGVIPGWLRFKQAQETNVFPSLQDVVESHKRKCADDKSCVRV
jgi:hypothetical protein